MSNVLGRCESPNQRKCKENRTFNSSRAVPPLLNIIKREPSLQKEEKAVWYEEGVQSEIKKANTPGNKPPRRES